MYLKKCGLLKQCNVCQGRSFSGLYHFHWLIDLFESFLIGEYSEISSTTSESVNPELDDSDTSESETELPDVSPPTDLTPFQQSVSDCKKVVDSIRKEEFGIGMELEDEAQRLMTRHQERIGRSLKRLSEELYSKDTHFVLELIQNADDNEYSEGVEPSLVFVVDRSEVVAMNNERGFSESNIRALCDVGRSTKGKHKSGYIGKKPTFRDVPGRKLKVQVYRNLCPAKGWMEIKHTQRTTLAGTGYCTHTRL